MIVLVVACAACFQPTGEDADSGVDAGRCFTFNQGISACSPPADPRVCGDSLCVPGTQCCLTTGQCAVTCEPIDGGNSSGGDPRKACATISDCAADEYCSGPDKTCFGAGECTPIRFCGLCGGDPAACAVCGCDGKTYPSPQAACAAGVRALSGTCNDGVNPTGVCVNQSQCGTQGFCCMLMGVCFRDDEAWRCQVLPDGGRPYDCRTDADCLSQSNYPGSTPPPMACIGAGCAGFGHCRVIGDTSTCTGLQKSVCGCDGQGYVNECWANSAGVRVSREGSCN